MSGILTFLEGYLTGNAWEDLCVQCYRLRYQDAHYTFIPATVGGDTGIEGFTCSGVVHQCYCPERDYSDNELYEHQRNKLTADIEKLKNNRIRIEQLGVPLITEWHLNVPEYKDSRIIAHAMTKQQEVLRAKETTPSNFTHIADNFKIYVKTAEDFAPEISRIIRTTVTDMRLNVAIQHPVTPDWSRCDSQKAANIRRKIKAVMLTDNDNDPDLNYVVDAYIEFYIAGIEIMNRLQVNFPEIYSDLFKLEQSCKRDVAIRTRMNTNNQLNQSLFDNILNEFERKLEKDFSQMLTQGSIVELKQDMVASWLADCSMEFRSTQNG